MTRSVEIEAMVLQGIQPVLMMINQGGGKLSLFPRAAQDRTSIAWPAD